MLWFEGTSNEDDADFLRRKGAGAGAGAASGGVQELVRS